MLLQPPRLNVAATFTQTNQRMGPRHEEFVAQAKQGNIDLLLHGDLDIGQKFLDDKGVFLPDSFRPDNLHPLAKGYDIWGQAVSASLAEMLN